MPRSLLALLLAPVAIAVALPNCTCQRRENIEAKARLSKPAPPDPHVKAADDKIDVEHLDDPKVMQRVIGMGGAEIAARLKSFSFTSNANLSFTRGDNARVHSAEKTRMAQADNGDFAVDVVTGDGSEMKLAYVNDIFFLKNNNGKWRIDRDPQGERNSYRSDALGAWKGFYDLVGHALVVQKLGPGHHGGRDVVRYRLSLPDQSAQARAEGANVAPMPVGPDGGPADEPAPEHRKRIADRMNHWRERAKPAGGEGELWVDREAGVITWVKFHGQMAVADGPEPARLEVRIDQSTTDVGKNHPIPMPKDAIEEVLRKKMPVDPRAVLEEEGVVPPLPHDGGPSTKGPGSKASSQGKKGELPDDDDDDTR